MDDIIVQPTCFDLQLAAYMISLRFNERHISYAFSGAFEVMLLSEIKDDSMTDHVEIVIDPKYIGLAQLLFEEGTPPHQELDVRKDIKEDIKVVNIYKYGPKIAVMVNFIKAGEYSYPPFQSDQGSSCEQDETLSALTLNTRSPTGELITAQVPVIRAKYLLYQRLASFQTMKETTMTERLAKRDILTQINICLIAAAHAAQNSIPKIGRFNKAQVAHGLRGYVLRVIEFAMEYGPHLMTEHWIEQWRLMGVPVTYEDLRVIPCQAGSDSDEPQEIWHLARDGL